MGTQARLWKITSAGSAWSHVAVSPRARRRRPPSGITFTRPTVELPKSSSSPELVGVAEAGRFSKVSSVGTSKLQPEPAPQRRIHGSLMVESGMAALEVSSR
ncbi:MAG: hypothetical protein QM765_41140 [Myxococcales bacterium]